MGHALSAPRGAAIGMGTLLALLAGAPASAQLSTYSVTGSGWTSLFGPGVINSPPDQLPFDMVPTNLPNGGQKISGSGFSSAAPIGQIPTDYAGGSGMAFAEPGRLGAVVDGVAYSGIYQPIVNAAFGATMTEYLPITSTTLPVGSTVNFNVAFHIDGGTSSETPNYGPGRFGPEFAIDSYNTGTFFFQFTGYTANGTTLAYNNDAVGSGLYSFPNGLYVHVPTSIDFGFTIPMTGKVGDYLVLNTQLAVGVDDRAGIPGSSMQGSDLDFSHTVRTFADGVTPGTSFFANGHDYSINAPAPGTALVMVCGGVGLARRKRCATR